MSFSLERYRLFNRSAWRHVAGFLAVLLLALQAVSQRVDISLDKNWITVANDSNKVAHDGFHQADYPVSGWTKVNVPHNWDGYEGYRRLRHGNRHGYAWYRKEFIAPKSVKGKRLFLFFEGVGSYATVWLNGKRIGYHAGGRTTFTIDVTGVVKYNASNLLAVRADHPANIRDLPWVCGGCSDDRGFSEGSQPMGIFRPVHLVVTADVRIEPFGVHVWNDTTASAGKAQLYYTTEVKNYSSQPRTVQVVSRLLDRKGNTVTESRSTERLKGNGITILRQDPPPIRGAKLWSLEDPYLYTLVSEIMEGGKVVDRISTPYGIRTVKWPVGSPTSKQFLLNGKPVFINGIAEYEHLLGASHAFSAEQVRSRALQMKAGGFNAFRDAHQPHNLRYHQYWDSLGILWWTQMSAHDWYDTKAFRDNFKILLREWVKERRNSPSLVLWGLQNESKLPEDFARECTAIIREMDPSSPSQRLVTTCNGGEGTDWDVPQNWTGTYGGDPATYGTDLKRQVLVGEYGAWRTLGLHTEGRFQQNGVYSEDRMTQLMEMKVRLAEAAKDSTAGHFMWLFTSHDNPGRVQGGEGYRELDRIGPVNYKGLLTPWEEPADVFFMYRSNYTSGEKEPMVYIASHTWPDRWTSPGKKDGITVYSNCDEVELFNDVRSASLGRKGRGGIGTHFRWEGVDIRYNVLYAVGYVKGKEVARDVIILHHLPQSPMFHALHAGASSLTASAPGYHYLYRVNCGGGAYRDSTGNTWLADRPLTSEKTWGSVSWAAGFNGMPPSFASQRTIHEPIRGTRDWKLFQSFRYGREKLQYHFPVQDGEYLVELYFTEPWLGRGGGMDATGWRLFDVAVNGKTVIKDLDIWKESGYGGALKKTLTAKAKGGALVISFPDVASGQALISAIAIASRNGDLRPAPAPQPLLAVEGNLNSEVYIEDWMTTGEELFRNDKALIRSLPPSLFGAQWLKRAKQEVQKVALTHDADVYLGADSLSRNKAGLPAGFDDTKDMITLNDGTRYQVFKKRFKKGETLLAESGFVVMATPAISMEPAYDLKAVASYKAVDARFSGPGLTKKQINGKERVVVEQPSADNKIEWQFSVGVADIYSLTITYNNPSTSAMKGRIQLLAADGTVMKQEEVEFLPTRVGKSNYIASTTGSMINAGHYKLILTMADGSGLAISALDVQ